MNSYPDYDDKTLSQLRMHECQGTIIGGMKVAQLTGMSAEEYGYQMMKLQQVDWSRAKSAAKIAQVFWQHFQTTYGFGSKLEVREDNNTVILTMPPLEQSAEYQLNHWSATATELQDIQRGYWRAITELCGLRSKLNFYPDQHQVILYRD